MKCFKSIILFSVMLFSSMVQSAPKETKENKTPLTVENAITIDVKRMDMSVDSDGQALAQFKYVVTNKSDKPISNIQWLSIYTHDRQVIYNQDMQLDLEKSLEPNKSITINLQIPFVKIDEKYRPIFINNKNKISIYKLEKIVEFSDKKRLTEK